MKNETLYWTIGGVAIALLALFAYSQSNGGGSSSSSSSGTPATAGGGISASALTSEVNAANANAASVEQTLLNDEAQYVTTSTAAQGGAFQSLVSAANSELGTIEGAQTARYAAGVNAAEQEYSANENALTAQFVATQQTAQTQANDAMNQAIQSQALNVQHHESDNAVTIARIDHSFNLGNFLSGLANSASSFFSGGTGAALLGVGGSNSTPAAPAPGTAVIA